MKKLFSLVLFASPHHAFAFDEAAKEHGVQGRLIPVPRTLSESCGMCFRIPYEQREELKKLFDLSLSYTKYIEQFESI